MLRCAPVTLQSTTLPPTQRQLPDEPHENSLVHDVTSPPALTVRHHQHVEHGCPITAASTPE
jgi:hypothetical protein